MPAAAGQTLRISSQTSSAERYGNRSLASHGPRDEAHDLPVRLRRTSRLGDRTDALDATLGVHERAVVLERRARGKEHSPQLACGLVHEEVLDHDELAMPEGLLRDVRLRMGEENVPADDPETLQRVVARGLEHLDRVEPALGRDGSAPHRLEDVPAFVERGGAGEAVRLAAHDGRPLDVVLPAQRVDARTRLADVARQQREVDETRDPVGALFVLGDPEPVEQHRRCLRRVEARRPANVVGRDAADRRHLLRGVLGDERTVRIDVVHALGEELLVDQVLLDDHVSDGVEERNIGPGSPSQVDVGVVGELDLSRVDHDEVRTAQCRLLDARPDDRMVLRRVRTTNRRWCAPVRCRRRHSWLHRCRGRCSARRRSACGTPVHSSPRCSSRARFGRTSAPGSCPRSWPGPTRARRRSRARPQLRAGPVRPRCGRRPRPRMPPPRLRRV